MHLAIASATDLEKIFGLPADAAKRVAHIPPDRRPQAPGSLQGIPVRLSL
jgi:hypothetical protein